MTDAFPNSESPANADNSATSDAGNTPISDNNQITESDPVDVNTSELAKHTDQPENPDYFEIADNTFFEIADNTSVEADNFHVLEDSNTVNTADAVNDPRNIRAYCSTCYAKYLLPDSYSGNNNLGCTICGNQVEFVAADSDFPSPPETPTNSGAGLRRSTRPATRINQASLKGRGLGRQNAETGNEETTASDSTAESNIDNATDSTLLNTESTTEPDENNLNFVESANNSNDNNNGDNASKNDSDDNGSGSDNDSDTNDLEQKLSPGVIND